MKTCWIFMILLCIAVVTCFPQSEPKSRAPFRCPESTNCSCIYGHDYEIQCPVNEPKVIVRVQPNHYIQIECEKATEEDYELIPEMDVSDISTLQIRRCPLPTGKSLAFFLDKIKMKKVRTLQFQSNGANSARKLEAQHFRSFTDLERLDIRGNDYEFKELPQDLFAEMTNLRWISIKISYIHLPLDIFAPLNKLEFLELGFNQLQHLEPGLLRNQTKLKHLNLWGNNLKKLNKDSFEGLVNVEELDLSANGIESLDGDVLTHLSNLTDINLSSNHFTTLPDGLLKTNRKLRFFKLIENRVPLDTLPAEIFSNLTNLRTVMIKCNLRSLPDDAFQGSENIGTISLARNDIEFLPAYLLQDQKMLETLDISRNLIQELPDELFIGAKSLSVLRLSFNRISKISKLVFQSLNNLQELYLDNNYISILESQSLDSLKSVQRIYLQNNQLTFMGDAIYEDNTATDSMKMPRSSRFQGLDKLQVLNLRNNSITTIFEDYTLISLRELDLSYNNISIFSANDLQFISREELTIDLTYNQIEEVDFKPPESVPAEVNILLEHNPIVCDCRILYFVKFLHRTDFSNSEANKIKIETGDLYCSKPENMANRSVMKLDPMDLLCSLDIEGSNADKRCPSECSCMVRPEDKALLINCSNSFISEVPRLPALSVLNLHHTELIIENSNLTELPTVSHQGYSDVSKIYVANNHIQQLNLENLPPKLQILQIHNNRLKGINHTVLEQLNHTKTLKQITLNGNPWMCDCTTIGLLNYVQQFHQNVLDYNMLSCEDNRKFNVLKPSDLCSEGQLKILIISIVIALVGLLIGLLAAFYYKYQQQIKIWLYARNMCMWFVSEEDLDKDKKYDAFLSYSHKDEDFITDHLVPELEKGAHPYKLCLHIRDWMPGEMITTQICNSVSDSRRTIIVMSPHFLESNWAQWEFRVAQSAAVEEKRSRIIVVLYGDIGDVSKLDPEIRDYLKLNTYVKWGDRWFWEKLRYAMPHTKAHAQKGEKIKGLVKTSIKSSVDDKLELIKPISVTPPQLTTPPAEIANPLIAQLNMSNDINQNGKSYNGYNGHVNGAFIINTNAKQSDV